MSQKCRLRTAPLDDGDADAIGIVSRLALSIAEAKKPAKHQALGEFLSEDELYAVAKLNHIAAYLVDRAAYPAVRAELYEGILETT